jgi:uncharacterized protein (DUF305 family)
MLALLALLASLICATSVGAAAEPNNAGGPPLYTEDDLRFLTHMIVHHQQAVEMAALVPSRTERAELIKFARYIDGAQKAEIDHMQGLLNAARDRGLQIPEHDMHGDPPMQGMLSKAQMAALAAAKGKEFERLWLKGMIYHHEGAMTMGLEQQKRQFESGRQPYGIDMMVDDILTVQRGEITKMKGWLAAWGLE